MQRLRSTWGMRWLAFVIGASMFTSFVAPMATAAQPSSLPFADWLRSQLREPAGADFEEALAAVEARDPATLHEYLSVFVEVYAGRRSGDALAEAFTGESLSPEALLLFLQCRYHRVAGEAVLPSTALSAMVAPQAKTPEHTHAASAGQAGSLLRTAAQSRATPVNRTEAFVHALRRIVTAQPLGP